jgi:uncharacterized membrane protein
MLIYFIRNSFKNNASDSSLVFRSFWYILLTVIVVIIGIFQADTYKEFKLYDYLLQAYNIYVFFGILALIIVIDLVAKLIVHACKVKKAQIASGEWQRKKEERRAKVVEKERLRMEKKLAKKEAKLNKKAAKIEAKLNKNKKEELPSEIVVE